MSMQKKAQAKFTATKVTSHENARGAKWGEGTAPGR